MDNPLNLLVVGCGKMGGAMLRRLAVDNRFGAICVVKPTPLAGLAELAPSVRWFAAPDHVDTAFIPDVVVLAVKPQHMTSALPAYARFDRAVFLSIAAGVTLPRLGALLGAGRHAIVRAMPNLPASIGAGVSVAVANPYVTAAQKNQVDSILSLIGAAAWLDDENLIDAVTALSGSGPAYVFALCEAMTASGTALGLDPALAAFLARQTLIGSGALLAQSADSAADLRRAVTSPGGTTEAALQPLLADDGLTRLMRQAMQAAETRSKELSR